MNLKYLIYFPLITCCLSFASAKKSVYIDFLNDFNIYEQTPTTFSFQTCWEHHQKIQFNKGINVPTIFTNQTNLPLKNPHTVVFLRDLDCPNAIDQLEEVDRKYFAFPYRWILLLSTDRKSVNSSVFDINALVDSSVTLAAWTAATETMQIEQFYKVEPNSTTIFESFGYWSRTTGVIDNRQTKVLSRRRRNLQKKILVSSVVLLHNDTINHLTDYKDKNVDSITKVSFVLLNQLLHVMNATGVFTYTNTWGYFDAATNRVTGLFGELLDKTADIGGTSSFMLPDRVAKFEFVSMIVPTLASFIFRPPPLSHVANIYYLPFEWTVWAGSGSMIMFSCFVIYLAFSRHRGDRISRVSDVALLCVGAICQMGNHIETKFLSTKISTIFFLMFLLFMYTSYTANIVSLLQTTTKSIRTLEHLLHSKFEMGVEDTPYNRWYFENSVEPVRRAVYEKKIAPSNRKPNFVNASYGIGRMREGFYAMHMEEGPAYKVVEDTFYEHEKCGLVEVDYLSVIEPWFVIQKHLPYKEIIKVNLFKIREHGVQSREVLKIYTKKPSCVSSGQNFQSVRLIDCYIVLQVWCTGFVMSIILLISEKIIHAKAPRSKFNEVCLY